MFSQGVPIQPRRNQWSLVKDALVAHSIFPNPTATRKDDINSHESTIPFRSYWTAPRSRLPFPSHNKLFLLAHVRPMKTRRMKNFI
ncbi:hypothetical protein BaRGS_00033400 [Batillaria attramentaria]|uniref:Uncharacterized protein n=1 Tax=Batillaria attramentaria TaxID=370345 RepID=A0ABD0JLM8_9CAEN